MEYDTTRYTCGGFLFLRPRRWYTDPEDYLDWLGYSWQFTSLMRDLHSGALPVGLIINVVDHEPMVVNLDSDNSFQLIPITDVYNTLSYNTSFFEKKKLKLTLEVKDV